MPHPARPLLGAWLALGLAAAAACAPGGSPTSPTSGSQGTSTRSTRKASPPVPAGSGVPASRGPGNVTPNVPASGTLSPGPGATTTPAPGTTTTPAPGATTTPAPGATTTPVPGTTVTPTPATTATPTPVATASLPVPGAAELRTFAGISTAGLVNGPAPGTAAFQDPLGLAVGPDGTIYVADSGNHAIRRIKDGLVTTLLGDGTATTPQDAARPRTPGGIAVANSGTLYIADTGNFRVRRLKPGATLMEPLVGRGVKGFADGRNDAAELGGPAGLALSGNQQFLWVVDSGSHAVRRVNLTTEEIVTVAGSKEGQPGEADGPGTAARFNQPKGCFAVGNDTLWVADSFNGRVSKVVLQDPTASQPAAVVTSYKVTGLSQPTAVVVSGDTLYVADEVELAVFRFKPGATTVEVVMQGDAPGFADGDAVATAQVRGTGDMVALPTGELLLADPGNHRIRVLRRR